MKKTITIFLTTIFFMLMISTNTYASTNYQIEVTTNKEEIKTSQELIITVAFKDLGKIQKGINAYHAKLEYDDNVFEEVTIANFESQNNWENVRYNKANKEFVAIHKVGIKQPEEILKIRLRAKKDASIGKQTVKISNFIASEGLQDLIQQEDNVVTATIVRDKEDNNSNVLNPHEQNKKEENDLNSNTAPGKLPKTGLQFSYLIILLCMELAGTVAFVSYKKQKNIQYQIKKKTIAIIILAILFSIQIIGTVHVAGAVFLGKGDVNKDGKIDYLDIELLQKHIIGLQLLSEENIQAGDINSNGKITVTDLSSLLWKVENKNEVMADIETITPQNYYAKKGEDIVLQFSVISNQTENFKNIQINGESYELQKDEQTELYKVVLNAGEKAGVQELHLEKLILENGKEAVLQEQIKVEVLKQIPIIENYTIEEKIAESKVIVHIDLKDEENALTKAYFAVKDLDVNQSLVNGENRIELSVKENKKYKAEICLDYDLDTNSLNDITGEQNKNSTYTEKEIELNVVYDLKVENIKTYLGTTATSIFHKKEEILLQFETVSSTTFEPIKLKVNGTLYKVEKVGTKYQVKLSAGEETGKRDLVLESLILSNGKELAIENKKVNIEVQKIKPTVQNFQTEEGESTIRFTFEVQDPDNTMQNGKIVLLDEAQQEIAREEITSHLNDITLNMIPSSNYTVKIIADYQLSEENKKVAEEIFTKEIKVKLKVKVADVVVDRYYLEKEGKVNITYTFESSQSLNITTLQINYIEYGVQALGDNVFQAEVMVSNEAGLQDIKLMKITNVIGETQEEVAVENIVTVEVLKDKLMIKNHQVIEDIEKSSVTIQFDVEDLDNSLEIGYIMLGEDESTKKTIKKGNNQITYLVTPNKQYTENYFITYDRDTNELNAITGQQNKVENEKVLTKQLELVQEHLIQITNVKTSNERNVETKYFGKKVPITLSFEETNNTVYKPQKVTINSVEYDLTNQGNKYFVQLGDFSDSGSKRVTLDNVILDNGKVVSLQNVQAEIEILKDEPTIKNFNYSEDKKANQIIVNFSLEDVDNAIEPNGIKAIIYNGKGENIKEQVLIKGEQTILIDKINSGEYKIEIVATYDLDTAKNGENEVANKKILTETLQSSRLYEIKDVTAIHLYEKVGDSVTLATEVDINHFELANYIVKIDMKEMTDIYATILSYEAKDNTLYLTLDMPNYVQYRDGKRYIDIVVPFAKISSENIASIMTMSKLLEKIEQDPAGTYELTQDLDVKEITSSTAVIFPVEFSGTLKGNGYCIHNLTKPLFNSLNGATMDGLIIDKANITANGRGFLANNAIATKVNNIHITNSTIKVSQNELGAIIGKMQNSTIIQNSSVSNTKVNGGKMTGGLVGHGFDSTIENCYINASTVTGNPDAIGGIIGQSNGVGTIQNCYAKVQMDGGKGNSKAGIIGYSSGTLTLKNSASFADGDSGTRVHGSLVGKKTIKDVYELSSSNMTEQGVAPYQDPEAPIKTVSGSVIGELLFNTLLKWDMNLWSMYNVSEDLLPSLMNDDPNYYKNQKIEDPKPQNPDIYIPNYTNVKEHPDYDATREIMYANLYRLMPFYEVQYLVKDGNKMPKDSILNQKRISMVIPYNNNKMVTVVTTDNYSSIDHIKVVFEDETIKTYTLKNPMQEDRIAKYRIQELDINYQYNKYVIDSNHPLIQELVQTAQGYTYEEDLDPLTSEADSRLYKDHYNEVTKKQLETFIIHLLANTEEYQLSNNEILNAKIKQDLTNTDVLKRLLYAYNYMTRWYNIQIDGINLRDVIYYGNLYGKDVNSITITNKLLAEGAKRQTKDTYGFYVNSLSKYTGKEDVSSFIEYFIKIGENYQNGDDWFTNTWQNLLLEIPSPGHEELGYRAWRHIKRKKHLILPILTLPKNSTYLLSTPAQFMIGSQRVYINNPDNENQRKSLLNSMRSIGNNIATFYATTAGFIEKEYINKSTDMSLDRRLTQGVYQSPGTTEEPFHKNFNEVVNVWPANNSLTAYATDNIYWVSNNALHAYSTWAHEIAHMQDSSIFLQGTHRRGYHEDHSDGNIGQYFADGEFHWNLTFQYEPSSNITTNFTTERINSREKLASYYRRLFETIYFLDYVEGLALIELTPAEQSRVAIQVSYPNVEDQEAGGSKTKYARFKTSDELEKMNLTTMEDLWDNHIVLRANTTIDFADVNFYNSEKIYDVRWYQPHNDKGRPDGLSLKRLAFEMIGVAGYDGYRTYYSNASKNDLEALRTIMGDETITWKKYKMDRYNDMKTKWDDMKLVSADQMLEEFKKALQADAKFYNEYIGNPITNSTNVRRKYYHYIKRATDDFRSEIFGDQDNIVHIKTAEELQRTMKEKPTGSIVLDNDIDLSALTYSESSLFDVTFTGRFNGNGHTIIGLQKPLFQNIKFAVIENLTIDSAFITADNMGAITLNATHSDLKQIHIKNSQIAGTIIEDRLVGKAVNCSITECSFNNSIEQGNNKATKKNEKIEELKNTNN